MKEGSKWGGGEGELPIEAELLRSKSSVSGVREELGEGLARGGFEVLREERGDALEGAAFT